MEELETSGQRALAQSFEADNSVDAEISALREELGMSEEEVSSLAQEEQEPPTMEQELSKGESAYGEFEENLKEGLPPSGNLGNLFDFGAGVVKGGIKSVEDIGNLAIDGFNAVDDWFEKRGGQVDTADNIKPLTFAPNAKGEVVEQAGVVVGRYFAPFMGWMKGVGSLTKLGKAGKNMTAVAGSAITSAAAVDPEDKNLSDLLNSIPALEGIVPDYLTSSPDDSMAEKRLKNGLEAVFVDAALLGTGEVLGKILQAKKTQRVIEKTKKTKKAALDAEVRTLKKEVQEKPIIAQELKAAKDGTPAPKPEFTPEQMDVLAKGKQYFEEPNLEAVQELAGKDNAIDFMQNMGLDDSPKYAEAYEAMRRGTQTVEEVTLAANKIASDPKAMEKLLKRPPGEAINAEELGALAMHAQKEYEVLKKLTPRAGKGFKDVAEKAAFMNQMARFRFMYEKMYTGSSEMGRGMRFFQESWKAAKDDKLKLDLIEEYVGLAGKDADDVLHYMQIAMKEGVDGQAVGKALARQGMIKKTSDIFFEHFYNGVLSGPATHAINFLSNSANAVMAPIEALVASGLSRNQTVYARESLAMIQGYWAAQREAISASMKTIITGKIPEGLTTKIPEIRESVIKMDGDGLLSNVVNAYGKMLNAPTSALSGADVYFKIANNRARVHQLAMRKALDTGLNPGTKEFNSIYKKIIENPPSDVSLLADKFSNKQTFTTPMKDLPGGAAMEGLQTFMERVPLGRAFTPFVRIAANINSAVLEMLPGASYLSPKLMSTYAKGGAGAYEQAAKMVVGSSFLGMGAYLAASGKLDGAGPRDYATRRALEDGKHGYRPNSYVTASGERIDLSKFQPFSTVLLMGADAMELMTHLDEASVEKIDDLIIGGLAVLGDRITPEFLTEGMPKFFDLLDKIEQGKMSVDAAAEAMGKFVASATPYSSFLKSTLKKYRDPLKRDTTPESEDFGAIWEKVKLEWQDMVGLGDELPVQRNIFGDPIALPAGAGMDYVSPFYKNSPEEDPLRAELQRLGLHGPLYNPEPGPGQSHFRVRMPNRTVKMGFGGQIYSVDLAPKEYEKYIMYSAGIGLGEDVPTLREALTEALGSDEAKNDEAKKFLVSKIISKYREAARGKMITDDQDIQRKFMEAAAYREYQMLDKDEGLLEERLQSIPDNFVDGGE